MCVRGGGLQCRVEAGAGPLRGGGAERPGGRRPQGAGRRELRPPLRPAPLPPRGSCADRGRRCLLVFPEGSSPSPLAQPRTWESEPKVEKDAPGPRSGRNRSRSLAAGRAAPWPRSPSPELSGLRVPLRVRSQGGDAGPGAGRRVRHARTGSSSRFLRVGSAGASPGREGWAVWRPAGRGGLWRPPPAAGLREAALSERRQVRAFSFFRAP